MVSPSDLRGCVEESVNARAGYPYVTTLGIRVCVDVHDCVQIGWKGYTREPWFLRALMCPFCPFHGGLTR